MVLAMSPCRFMSLVEDPLVRYGLLGLLVSMLMVVACASVSSGDTSQKLAAAVDEMSLVVVLFLLHLAVSKLGGDVSEKSRKKKTALEDRDGTDPAPDEADGLSSQEAREQAIGKITTKIRAAVKIGDMQAAEALMQGMCEIGGQPGKLRRPCWSVAFGEIVNGYIHGGNAKKAGEWLDAFADGAPAIRPSTACVNSVITAFCDSGDISSAEEWLTKMPRAGIRVDEDTFSALIQGCLRTGDVPRSIHWLREMRRANLRPRTELSQLVLQACAGGCTSAAK